MKTTVFLFLFTHIFIIVVCKYNQEYAKVTYWNPKYVSKATTFTMRSRRREQYRTNITVVITQAWCNNVTMKISYQSPVKAIDLNFVSKLCDVFSHSWYQKFLRKFSSLTWSCPVVPGSYVFTNVDLDQTVLPLPMPRGKNILSLKFYMTLSHEPLLEGQVSIVAD